MTRSDSIETASSYLIVNYFLSLCGSLAGFFWSRWMMNQFGFISIDKIAFHCGSSHSNHLARNARSASSRKTSEARATQERTRQTCVSKYSLR
jgi:hypothetical protein